MNKKGFIQHILTLGILALVIVGIMLLIFVVQLAMPIFSTISTETGHLFILTTSNETPSNLSIAATTATTAAIESIQMLEWISYVFIIMLIITFFGIAYFVRSHPFLIVFWIFIIICLVFVSLFLTVSYQDVKSDPYLASMYEQWESTDYLLSWLPHIITAIGILGGIVLFILITREPESEATVL